MNRIIETISSVFSGDKRDWRTRLRSFWKTAGVLFSGVAVLLAATLIILIIHGNNITMYYRSDDPQSDLENLKVEISDEDVVRVISTGISGDLIRIRVERAGTGDAEVKVYAGDTIYTEQITTRYGLIIRETTSDFPCWQLSVLCGFLFSTWAAYKLYNMYRSGSNESMFLYSSIYELALAVFFAVVAAGTLFLLIMLINDPNSFTFRKVIDGITNLMIYFSIFSLPLWTVLAIALCISNIQLLRKEGFRRVNLLGIALSGVITLGVVAGGFLLTLTDFVLSYRMQVFVVNSYLGVISLFNCIVAALFIVFIRITKHEPSYDKDYIVILGCAVKADGTLYPLVRGRVDRALEFAEKQVAAGGPVPIFIPSGGKGGDEPVSEGEAMGNYLLSRGITEDRVFPETESTNTRENMIFSKRIAEKVRPGGIGAFSTTNYHVFRSGVIAGDVGIDMDGMGAPTKWYFWPNALVREFIGLLWNDLPNVILVILFIFAMTGLLAML